MQRRIWAVAAVVALVWLASPEPAQGKKKDELPLKAAVLIIETTDNDIELQAFVDGVEWKRLRIFDPDGHRIFLTKASGKLKQQGGLSELFWASEPSHYLEEEPDFDEPVEAFLARHPPGDYEFEAVTPGGDKLHGVATLTHVLPAIPEIISPVPNGEDPPVVDPTNTVIEWEPVTTRFIGVGPVEIIEYQVILDAVEPERDMPWVDGGTRRALINLTGSTTSLTVPPEFLEPGAEYEFEILAIEASGNSTIAVGEFVTSE